MDCAHCSAFFGKGGVVLTRRMKRVFVLLLCVLLAFTAGDYLSFSSITSAAATDAAVTDEPPYYLQGSQLVYITQTGKRYHCIDDCGNTQTAYLVSLEEACRLGYTPCGRCHPAAWLAGSGSVTFPEGSEIVYFEIFDEHYHSSQQCKYCKNGVPVTLEEALYLGRTPCAKCVPSP